MHATASELRDPRDGRARPRRRRQRRPRVRSAAPRAQGPQDEDPAASHPAARSPAASTAVATRQPRRSTGERRARRRNAAVTVGVGLDHGADLRAARRRREPGRVALDRAEVDSREAPQHRPYRTAPRPSRPGAGSSAITSRAMTPVDAQAGRGAHACPRMQPHAGGGGTRRIDAAARAVRPSRPLSTSPVPAVASAAVAPELTSTVPDGSTTSVSSPLSTTTAPERRAASRAREHALRAGPRRSRCRAAVRARPRAA